MIDCLILFFFNTYLFLYHIRLGQEIWNLRDIVRLAKSADLPWLHNFKPRVMVVMVIGRWNGHGLEESRIPLCFQILKSGSQCTAVSHWPRVGEDLFTSSSDTLQDAHILGVIDFKMHIYWQIGSNRKLHPDGQNTVQAGRGLQEQSKFLQFSNTFPPTFCSTMFYYSKRLLGSERYTGCFF